MFNTSQAKIGYLLKTYPKISETFILNEILELENQGIDLHIFSLRRPSDDKFHPNITKVRAKVTYIPSILPQLKISEIGYLLKAHFELIWQHPERYFKMLQFYSDRTEKKRLNEFLQAGYLVRELQKLGIAHLHAHFANIPAAVAELVHEFCHLSYSITAHAKDIYLSEPQALDRRMKKAKFVLTCTAYNQRHLQDISTSSTPIYLSYHGLDIARFQPSYTDQQIEDRNVPLILSVGRFCEKKGFPYLLQACWILKQKGHQFRCTIVGYGPMQAEIEQMIEDFQLEDIVSLPGKMTQDELIQLYRKADIFTLPCQITDDGDRDGIPNVLLEAMAMKVPVISTDISGIAELIHQRKNGILVPQKDADSLAKEIENLITKPQLMQQLRQAGREKVLQQFCLEKNTRQIKHLFLNTLNPSSQQQKKETEKIEVTV